MHFVCNNAPRYVGCSQKLPALKLQAKTSQASERRKRGGREGSKCLLVRLFYVQNHRNNDPLIFKRAKLCVVTRRFGNVHLQCVDAFCISDLCGNKAGSEFDFGIAICTAETAVFLYFICMYIFCSKLISELVCSALCNLAINRFVSQSIARY